MDYLTKWPEVFPVPDQTATTVAKVIVEGIICRHGVPEGLLSDRGYNFMSELVSEICELTGMKKFNTSPNHTQTDGMIERFNRTLLDMIAKYSVRYGPEWDQYLPYLLFVYRTRVHESSG